MIRYHVCPQPFRGSGIMCVRVRRAGKGWIGDRSASDTRTGRVQPLQYHVVQTWFMTARATLGRPWVCGTLGPSTLTPSPPFSCAYPAEGVTGGAEVLDGVSKPTLAGACAFDLRVVASPPGSVGLRSRRRSCPFSPSTPISQSAPSQPPSVF